jgi:uncharacterized protein YkwD
MAGVRLIIFALVAGLAAVFPMARAQTFSLPVPETKGEQHFELERETFALVNDYRHAHDLPVLVWNAAIAETARGHSRDMAERKVDFGHEGFGDRVDLLRRDFGGLQGAGENVLYTSDPQEVARNAVNIWLHSPPHLHNIRGDFNYSGIGVWENKEGLIYFTQIFIRYEARAPAE